MQAIILAAGLGSRLGNLTKSTHKTLLPLNNKETIIENTIKKLVHCGIAEIIVVTGYLSHKIDEEILKLSNKYCVKIQSVYNPFWNSCNVLGSFFIGLNKIHNDFIFIHADTLFDKKILTDLIKHEGNILAISKKKVGDEEMKVWINNDSGNLIKVSKIGEANDALGEFTGVAKFNYSTKDIFLRSIYKLSKEEGHLDLYMESAIQYDLENHNEMKIQLLIFDNLNTIEIDFEDDYNEAKSIF